MEGACMPSRYRGALGAASAAILAIAAGAAVPGGPAVAATTPAVATTTPAADATGRIRVIVEYSDADAAARAVIRAGGTVGRALSVVDGFVAQVPGDRLTALETAP